ncbi:hypothetical protein PSEUBRA_006163 [Kalmanozyma brasiliensis GHG001]|uniref:uncharacterized protein n=1 Tax=Kalmanozyma brasiliensis (strain GHG001) TaxID=1365824 RepID=UPI001CE7E1BA|nr:uncharacterized protein PSEUBRA_006163 [Kalmanozyma brasiliensis GHG001]KAF6767634.1 hypothetical protein PSEUBRA_006163 [Kalmanozyma brasiliensis GHG001]
MSTLSLYRGSPLIFIALAIAILSGCVGTTTRDAEMLQATRALQSSLHTEAGFTFRRLQDYHILSTPDVVTSAWELAQTKGFIRTNPPSFLVGRLTHDHQPYFFSTAHPLNALYEEMGLWHHPPAGEHKIASFLWTWEGNRARLVHVDLLQYTGLRWSWQPLEEVLDKAR